MEKGLEALIWLILPLSIYGIISIYFSRLGIAKLKIFRWLLIVSSLTGAIFSPSCMCVEITYVILYTLATVLALSSLMVGLGFLILKFIKKI